MWVHDTNSRFLALIRNAVLFLFLFLAGFLVLSGRPTADEFLLAPVLDGYYVDQPTVPLFADTESRFVNYFKGARAIVKLGWDAWPNALTFQMGSGTLVNYFGPIATILQGLIFACLWIWSLSLLIRKLVPHQTRWHQIQGTSVFVLGAMAAMSVANFHTTRTPFGLYPFLGIRFGLYVIHALFLVALVVQTISLENQRADLKRRTMTLYLWTVTFVGFVSLWYVFYLLVFVVIRGVIQLLCRRSVVQYAELLVVTAASTLVFYEGLGGVRNRTVAKSAGFAEVVRNYFGDVILNTESRLFSQELWSTVVGRHSLVAWMFGVVAMLSIPPWRRADGALLKTLTYTSCAAILVLPPLFALQEFVTYEAWWHRSTPIMLSSISFMIFGAWFARLTIQRHAQRTSGLFVGLAIAGLIALCASPITDSASSINRFRKSWDSGNILALGFPVENNADYNVINAFRMGPYRKASWDVQTRMLQSIPTSIIKGEARGLRDDVTDLRMCQTEVEFKSSPFDTELGGEVEYKLELSHDVELMPVKKISVLDKKGPRWADVSLNSTLIGTASVPGRIRVTHVASDCTRLEPIEQLALRFTSDIRKSRSMPMEDYVMKGVG